MGIQLAYRLKNLIIFSSIGILLTACMSPLPKRTNAQLNNQTKECLTMTRQYYMAEELTKMGIQVIQIGDQTQLILSTDQFFYPQSNHLEQKRVNELNQIIQFINSYQVTNVQVIGFTDNLGDYTRNIALSRAQAQTIAHYLGINGLNARLITATGQACHQAIALNNSQSGRRQNRRIEINFQTPASQNVFH